MDRAKTARQSKAAAQARQSAATAPHDLSVVIVGGGIAGLYAAYLLGRLGCDVQLFELSRHWGGRIDSRRYRLDESHSFIAEFGPMRFEPDLQERLRRLCLHLDIEFERFTPTTAPIGTTNYDLTAEERSLRNVADLLKWAVLRMFFEEDVKPLEATGPDGPRHLAMLRRHMDTSYFVNVAGRGANVTVMARPDEQIQEGLKRLRETATLCGRDNTPVLAELGLWNALTEVLTPGAIAKIRDSGTFYHFIAQNPSALEWGIFWLRQASVLGDLFQFTGASAHDGTHSLVIKLKERIERECKTVRLLLGHEVVRVEHGKRPDEVAVRVTCHDETGDSYSFSQRADHVILALPQLPLLRLAEHFPKGVCTRLESVIPVPLLKAFLVTKKPWWRPHLKAQTYAWLVPTRELHFVRPDERNCPRFTNPNEPCTCNARLRNRDLFETGMVMLYTDQPAIRYWQALMTPKERGRTTWAECDAKTARGEVRKHPYGLLASLIRRVVMIPAPVWPQRPTSKRIRSWQHLKTETPGFISESKTPVVRRWVWRRRSSPRLVGRALACSSKRYYVTLGSSLTLIGATG